MRIFFDAILINLSFILAYYLRFNIFSFVGAEATRPINQYGGVLLFVTILWLAVFNLVGFYKETHSYPLIDKLAKIIWGITLASTLLFALLFIYRSFWFSRLVILNSWWIAIVLIGFSRTITTMFRNLLYRKGIGLKRVLILGEDEIANALNSKFLNEKSLGYFPVGLISADPSIIKQAIIEKGLMS